MHTKEASGMHVEVVDGSEHTLRTAQGKLPYQTTLTNYAPASKLARHDTVYGQKKGADGAQTPPIRLPSCRKLTKINSSELICR